jgi:hypothetical protein
MSLEQDIADVRDAVTRQEGCTVKDCSVCSGNRRRCDAAERVIALAQTAAAANALLREWYEFDFDCPDDFNDETGEEDDGYALDKLCADTAAHFTELARRESES